MNAVTLSLYLGYGIYTVFPFKDFILNMGGGAAASRTVLSLLLFAIAVTLSHVVVKQVMGRSGPVSVTSRALQFILAIGFVLAVGYQSFAITRLYEFPPIINTIFNPTYFFYWYIAPLVGLFFFSR
ncbi:MAG: hypothetical protein P4M11_01485 [Candidatus Pacebacteria bacterium]|nr:hypothetical protein [Candidatus Paceibacterota bacterium]